MRAAIRHGVSSARCQITEQNDIVTQQLNMLGIFAELTRWYRRVPVIAIPQHRDLVLQTGKLGR